MKTIETTATVADDGRIIVYAPAGVAPGTRKVVLILGDEPEAKKKRRPLPIARHGRLAENVTLSREEIYDDTGR